MEVTLPSADHVADQLISYAACVFESSDIVNLRFIQHATDHVPNFFFTAADLGSRAVRKCLDFNGRGYSIYAGVNPRMRKGGTKAQDVAMARCLFTEWDAVSVEEARRRWQEVGLPEPTLSLFSGAGPHAYWRFTVPLADLVAWTDLQKRLLAAVQSDNIHDWPRVMRLPGFINQKPDRGQVVQLLDFDPNRRYPLDGLAAALPQLDAGDNLGEDDKLPDFETWAREDAGNATGLKPGQDFDQRGDTAEVILRNGWTFVRKETDGAERWRRAGKTYGISASVKDRWLYCFTTSTKLPARKALSPFAVLAYLEHDGDFSAAAKALAAKGYGEKPAAKPATKLWLPEPFQPFPTAVLPRVCADFIEQSAHSIDCDESMVALPLIGATAAAIGNSCRIGLKEDYSEPTPVWAGIICESGSRKSAAVDAPIRPVRRREGEEIRKYKDALSDYESAMLHYKAVLSKWQRKGASAGEPQPVQPEKPVCRRFIVSDVTTEALAVRLEQNPRGLLLARDELAGFFTGLNQYKPGGRVSDETAFLLMHGARPLNIDRKNPERPSIFVPMANLSVIGAIQPGTLRRILTRNFIESGMAARFLFAYPPSRAVKWREKCVDRVVADRLATMFDFLLSLPLRLDEHTNEPEPLLLPISREAKYELWIPFHDEHSAEQAELRGDLSAAWAKLTGYAARLSLICQLMTWAAGGDWDPPTEVSVEALQSGIALAKWFSGETKRVYAILEETDDQRDARELVDYISQKGGNVTTRDLTRGPRRFRENPDLAEAELQRLATGGKGHWVNQSAGGEGGRPTRFFRLNSAHPGDETPANSAENGGSVAVATNSIGADEEGEWVG